MGVESWKSGQKIMWAARLKLRHVARTAGFNGRGTATRRNTAAIRIESRLQIRPCAEKHSTGTSGWLCQRADTSALLESSQCYLFCMLHVLVCTQLSGASHRRDYQVADRQLWPTLPQGTGTDSMCCTLGQIRIAGSWEHVRREACRTQRKGWRRPADAMKMWAATSWRYMCSCDRPSVSGRATPTPLRGHSVTRSELLLPSLCQCRRSVARQTSVSPHVRCSDSPWLCSPRPTVVQGPALHGTKQWCPAAKDRHLNSPEAAI